MKGGRKPMIYIINGDVVSAETYERDRNDNFNCGIAFEEVETETTLTMEYDD